MSTYNNEPKQTMWETWFIISCIVFLCLFVIGTSRASVEFMPNYPYYMGITVLNLCVCLYYGCKK